MGNIYKKGLSFECQGCNYCCSVEPGYVFLSQEDLDNLSLHFQISQSEFIDKYCRKVDLGIGYRISLIEKDNYDCIFLTKKGCYCYNARPLQCRTYPFWPTIIESQKTWENEGQSCPGIEKGSKKIKKSEIEKKLQSMKDFIPIIIMK
ncbi:MAG: YkgJ family cysteine cluster protein [Spirochaetaceae bacterium]|nr:YkgJ family cysteine cluster protein [Spirochaetaceae bacterium]